jgi:hypothetical protein
LNFFNSVIHYASPVPTLPRQARRSLSRPAVRVIRYQA